MNKDLRYIKRYYGEKMMHLCRELFPTILEKEGVLFKILEENFYYNKFLYDDIIKDNRVIDFKDFIYSKYYDKDIEKKHVYKTPYELLKMAGYTLYECKSEEDIQKFKKYYAKDEELCTFWGGRLDRCMVFFAVKDNANELRREDFINPDRQDEYGTSVISIQYQKGVYNTLSVKNRYNHTVNNPDATFSNNLDNIIDGLNDSFEEMYNLSHTGSHNKFEISGYVRANDGRFYKYNYEINGIFYCVDNIIIDNYRVIDKYKDKEKYILMDYFIIDLVNKKISTYKCNIDNYTKGIRDIKKIEVLNDKDNGNKKIILYFYSNKKVVFEINKYNKMVKLEDDVSINILSDSLVFINSLKEIKMNNVIKCYNNFLRQDLVLEKCEMNNVKYIGNCFLLSNRNIKEIFLPNVLVIGNYFMSVNDVMEELYLPKLKYIGDNFMGMNRSLKSLNLPNIERIGGWFFASNKKIEEINMPNLKEVLSEFLSYNQAIKYVNLPNLVSVKNNFMKYSCATKINLPKLKNIGDNFMQYNMMIDEIDLLSIEKIGNDFISDNTEIRRINMPKLVSVDNYFLEKNVLLKEIELPNLINCGSEFIAYNESINKICLPNIIKIGNRFLWWNNSLEEIVLGSVEEIGEEFLGQNMVIKRISAPKLKVALKDMLYSANNLEYIDMNQCAIINLPCHKELIRKK